MPLQEYLALIYVVWERLFQAVPQTIDLAWVLTAIGTLAGTTVVLFTTGKLRIGMEVDSKIASLEKQIVDEALERNKQLAERDAYCEKRITDNVNFASQRITDLTTQRDALQVKLDRALDTGERTLQTLIELKEIIGRVVVPPPTGK